MDKFLMICYVCADFVGKNGELFRITPENLGVFVEAPAWIKKTIIYTWLVNDGSIKTALDTKEQKKLENDPMEGITSEGKSNKIEEAPEGDPNHEDFPPKDEELTEGEPEAPAKEAEQATEAKKATKPANKSKSAKSKKGEGK